MIRDSDKKEDDVDQVVEVLTKDVNKMQRPLVVDWENKKAVLGRPVERIEEFLKK